MARRSDIEKVKQHLQGMGDYDFEYFVADLWERDGWDCEVSQASADAGIDVTATKSTPYKRKKLIQAKRYGPNSTVGGPDIQQYASLKFQEEGVESVVVVTTNRFTQSAEDRAEDLGVELVDGEQLVHIIAHLDAADLLQKYPPEQSVAATSTTSSNRLAGDGMGRSQRSTDVSLVEEWQTLKSIFSPISNRISNWLTQHETSWKWHLVFALGTGLWFLSTITTDILHSLGPPFDLFGALLALFVVLPLPFLLPFAWYMDVRYVRRRNEWSPNFWAYFIGTAFLMGLPLLYYYYKRRKTIGWQLS